MELVNLEFYISDETPDQGERIEELLPQEFIYHDWLRDILWNL